MNKSPYLVCVGEALIDFTPTANGTYTPNAGGAPYNVAACASKFGVKASFIGSVGKDALGTLIKDTAVSCGVDVSCLSEKKENITTHAFVTLSSAGERDFIFSRDADTNLTVDEIDRSILNSCTVLHVGSLSLTAEPIKSTTLWAIETARKGNALVSFDPNYRQQLWSDENEFVAVCNDILQCVDILKVSEDEASMLTGEFDAEKALKKLAQNRLVFMTCGDRGAYYALENTVGHVNAVKADTVDTTGAGDIFFGVALSEIMKKGGLPKMLSAAELNEITQKACYYASKSTERFGAVSSIPEICN